MRHSLPSLRLLVLTGSLVGLSAGAVAQEAAPRPASSGVQVVSIKFRGGTLDDYVEAIRDAGDKINILLPPEAGKVRVPEIDLQDAEVEAALEAVTDVVDRDWSVDVKTRRTPFGQPVHSVSVRDRRKPQQMGTVSQGSMRSVQVFSLRSLTDRLPGDPSSAGLTISPETILTAIDTGLAITSEQLEEEGVSGMAVIKYHQDSGLLFVQGRHEHTNLVGNVLLRMEQDLSRRRDAAAATTLFGEEARAEDEDHDEPEPSKTKSSGRVK